MREGITPDIKLRNVSVDIKEGGNQYIKEADLKGHLENGKKHESKNTKKKNKKDDKKDKPLASTDYPLYEALNLLKGLNLLKK